MEVICQNTDQGCYCQMDTDLSCNLDTDRGHLVGADLSFSVNDYDAYSSFLSPGH